MAATRSIRRALTALLAVVVLTSTFVAPVHADDDGGVTIDGDGITIDEGTGVTVGDDENGTDTEASVSVDEEGADVSTSGEVNVNGGDDSEDGASLSLDCGVSTDDADVSDDCGSNVIPEDAGDDGVPSVDQPSPDAPEDDVPSVGDAPELSEDGLPGAPTVPSAPSLPGVPSGGDRTMEDLPAFPGTPENPVDVPALPVRYDDIPLESAPGDACTQPVRVGDIPEPIDPYNPPGEENLPREIPSTPVDPYSPPVSAPFTQCDVFDPYDPPFDPTDPPDDPSAEERRFADEASQERVLYVGEQTFTTGEGGPSVENFGYVLVVPGENTTMFGAEPSVSDGQKEVTSGEFAFSKGPGQRQGSVEAAVLVFGSGGGAGLVCDGEECETTTEGVPQQDIPVVPTNSSGGVPCQSPAGPGDAPAVPEPPASPPEQVPEPPAVDPSDAPDPNYCPVFNPNNPPVDPENPPSEPYQERRTYADTFGPNGGYTVGEDEAGFRSGPTANRFYGYGFDDEQAVYFEEVTIDTGERQYIVETSNVWTRDTSTAEGRSGVMVTMKNGSTSIPQGAELVCDGEKCQVVVTGDMGATDGLPPVYVDDDGNEDGTQSGSAEDSASGSTDSASERTVDATSDSVEEYSEDVPTDEIVGQIPDLSTPGDAVTALLEN